MSDVRESLTLLCPYDQAPEAAIAYLNSLPSDDGTRVAVVRAKCGELLVERRVAVRLHEPRPRHHGQGVAIMDIRWDPHDCDPRPTFTGTLTVEDGGGNFSHLTLVGRYEAPDSFSGQLFDAVLGNRIALATCRQLLDDIKTGFEFAFQTGMTIA